MIGLVVAFLTGSRHLEGHETSALISVPLLDRTVWGGDVSRESDDRFRART